jgi:hypothetical protein
VLVNVYKSRKPARVWACSLAQPKDDEPDHDDGRPNR